MDIDWRATEDMAALAPCLGFLLAIEVVLRVSVKKDVVRRRVGGPSRNKIKNKIEHEYDKLRFEED